MRVKPEREQKHKKKKNNTVKPTKHTGKQAVLRNLDGVTIRSIKYWFLLILTGTYVVKLNERNELRCLLFRYALALLEV